MLGIGCPDRHALQRITSPKLRRPRRLLPSRERVRSSAQPSPPPPDPPRSPMHTRSSHSTYTDGLSVLGHVQKDWSHESVAAWYQKPAVNRLIRTRRMQFSGEQSN